MITVKCKKIKRINYKMKDIQHKYLHYSDCLLFLNYEQQQIMNLYRLIMFTVTLCNTNNVNDDILNKWCLYTIKTTLKLKLTDIINCYDDNIVNKCIQVINSAIKEHKNLLSLMHYKMTKNFLLNWVIQLLKHLVIVTILIFNNVISINVVADMLWTAKI